MEPFLQQSTEMVENVRDLILSDVWGSAQVEGPGCEWYFFSYIDFRSLLRLKWAIKSRDYELILVVNTLTKISKIFVLAMV